MKMLDEMFNAIEASDEFKEWDKKNEDTKKLFRKKEVLLDMGDLASEIISISCFGRRGSGLAQKRSWTNPSTSSLSPALRMGGRKRVSKRVLKS